MATTYGENQRVIKSSVLDLLERYEQARNDDKWLMLKYWQEIDNINTSIGFGPSFLRRGTSPESICRARRSIQSSGLFPPTDLEVMRKRRIRQEEAREHHVAE
jgi:hypothetical protein